MGSSIRLRHQLRLQLALYIEKTAPARNPWVDTCCWVDEDHIGMVCRMVVRRGWRMRWSWTWRGGCVCSCHLIVAPVLLRRPVTLALHRPIPCTCLPVTKHQRRPGAADAVCQLPVALCLQDCHHLSSHHRVVNRSTWPLLRSRRCWVRGHSSLPLGQSGAHVWKPLPSSA